MRAVVVRIPDDGELEDSADYIKHVAQQMEEGYTSGHVDREHYWSVEEVKDDG